MSREDVPPEATDFLAMWPKIERVERWQRVWDWVLPVFVLAVIATLAVFGDAVSGVFSLVLAFMLGALMDQARWRRRSFRGMKERSCSLRSRSWISRR